MPLFDGTGPQGEGPMTGRGMGYCVLQESKVQRGQIEGLTGIQGTPMFNISSNLRKDKEVINMPRGNGTPMDIGVGMGPMTGRAAGFCAGYPVAGFMNPARARGYAFAGAPSSSYGSAQPASGYGSAYVADRPWLSGVFARAGFGHGCRGGFGRGRGFRGGRGGFGRW